MSDYTKNNIEKAKALRRLIKKWLTAQGTRCKADLLLSKNPELKIPGAARYRKIS